MISSPTTLLNLVKVMHKIFKSYFSYTYIKLDKVTD